MDEQNRNLILAIILSTVVLVGWTIMFPPPEVAPQEQSTGENTTPLADTGVPLADPVATPSATEGTTEVAAADAIRIPIETPRLKGSISTQGGRIDDLSLVTYSNTIQPNSENVSLLSPIGQEEPYYATFGWVPGGELDFEDVPGANTIWTLSDGVTLTPETPVELSWSNAKGLKFVRTIEVDEDYLFSITQRVENTGDTTVRLAPHNRIVRIGQPKDQAGFFIIHEGAIRQTGEGRVEYNWNDFPDLGHDDRWGPNTDVERVEGNGWLGFTDHYWMTMLIPEATQSFESVLQYTPSTDTYSTIARLTTLELAPGTAQSVTTGLFAGAKEWETIRNYEAGRKIEGFGDSFVYGLFGNPTGINEFLDSIDWGWFFFLTKPIFFILHEINSVIGNMGWSIIGLTLLIKALLFPLAYKSYVSMAKMKELQPEMEKLKERAGDDRQKLQKEMMELYRKEKVNPASGCLPILLQIPIFFSLYKVIFVTIELRHAPWFGWIKDLSAPDPSSILNLFGLLPFAVPDLGFFEIFSLGILPILMGISMWLQQKLNPAPTDPTQAMIFAWMPWVFMFMLGTFASGLIIYWIANNMITFTQQYLIMRSQGYTPDVFGNIKQSFKRKKPAGDKK